MRSVEVFSGAVRRVGSHNRQQMCLFVSVCMFAQQHESKREREKERVHNTTGALPVLQETHVYTRKDVANCGIYTRK